MTFGEKNSGTVHLHYLLVYSKVTPRETLGTVISIQVFDEVNSTPVGDVVADVGWRTRHLTSSLHKLGPFVEQPAEQLLANDAFGALALCRLQLATSLDRTATTGLPVVSLGLTQPAAREQTDRRKHLVPPRNVVTWRLSLGHHE